MGKRALLNDTKKRSFLIFGGHSPVAIAVANRLATEGKVFLVTRNIDSEIKKVCAKEITLVEADIESFVEDSLDLKPLLEEIHSVIFAHRFRGIPEDIEEAFRCEVLQPYALVNKIVSIKRNSALRNIVFFTSPGASKILGDQPIGYHLTKSAVSQMVRYLAVGFAEKKINVVGISPSSFVAKSRSKAFYRKHRSLKAAIERKIPSKTFFSCEEIAELVTNISTSENLFLTGNILELDHALGLLEASTLIKP